MKFGYFWNNSDDIGAFVLGKACCYSSVLDTGGAQYHPVKDSSAACPLTSTCVPLQRLKNIPHSHAVCIDKNNGTTEQEYCTCMALLVELLIP